MSNPSPLPFLPGSLQREKIPLERFLPPLNSGMVASWLKKNVPPGEWIIDPIGSTPALALEAAGAGYRVLVASNNPINSFILQVLAQAPDANDFKAALSILSTIKRGEERLDVHLQSLYQTECPACSQMIPALAYLWKRTEEQPYARLIHCPRCGREGEVPITPGDTARLMTPGSDSLHRSRAIERVCSSDQNLRKGAEEAINTYLPRSLYFISTLINKIEGLSTQEERSRLLRALALSICEEGSSLWSWPASRSRPRQLSQPNQFRENNLWLTLENAASDWSGQKKEIQLTRWPNLPIGKEGICLFQGRLRSLLPLPENILVRAAIAVFPRPNQAYWTLSAIWSGWMWGHEAAQPLHSALERQRYDWQWHAAALHNTFALLNQHFQSSFPFWAILPELVPGFLSSAIAAAEAGGFHLENISLRNEQELAQILWQKGPSQAVPAIGSFENIAQEAVEEYLAQKNEPAAYLPLLATGLEAIARQGAIPGKQTRLNPDIVSGLQNSVGRALTSTNLFRHYGKQSQNLEVGWWWLVETPEDKSAPQADQIETEVVRYLHKNPGCTIQSIDEHLCNLHRGLFTPSLELSLACLESYAEPFQNDPGHWQLRSQESSANRWTDLQSAGQQLKDIAQVLGVNCRGEHPLVWEKAGQPIYCFFLLASAWISRFVLPETPLPPRQCILILPGSRINLLMYKLHQDPRLSDNIARGWHILKFRHLRQFAVRRNLSLAVWDELLDNDPPRWEDATQISISF